MHWYEKLWEYFCKRNTSFPAKYKVYQFYKQQGYCLRSGIHYGVDFSVYRDHQSMSHSEMSVLVVSAGRHHSSNISSEVEAVPKSCPNVSWRYLSSLTRIMPDVMKLLVICYVVRDAPSSSSTSDSAECNLEEIEKWKVRPVTALSRRSNNRSDDFSTIANIQKKYQQQSKTAVAKKQFSSNKRKLRDQNQGVSDAKIDKKRKFSQDKLGDNGKKSFYNNSDVPGGTTTSNSTTTSLFERIRAFLSGGIGSNS